MSGLMAWINAAADFIAANSAFQEWVGAYGTEDARPYIILFNSDDDALPERYCGIYQETFERNREGLGAGEFRSTPVIILHFEEAVDSTDPTQAALVAIATAVDAVMAEAEQSGNISGWAVDPMDPSRAEWQQDRDHVTCRVAVRFVQ